MMTTKQGFTLGDLTITIDNDKNIYAEVEQYDGERFISRSRGRIAKVSPHSRQYILDFFKAALALTS